MSDDDPRAFNFTLELSADHREVHLRFSSEGQVINQAASAEELDDLIEILGRARASMVEEIPINLEPGARVHTFSPARIRIQKSDVPGHTLLVVRHPGFGWSAFDLSKEQTKQLRSALRSF